MKHSDDSEAGRISAHMVATQYERLFNAALTNGQPEVAREIVLYLYDLLDKAMSKKQNTSEAKCGSNRELFESIIDTRYVTGALHTRLLENALNHNAGKIKEILIRLLSNIVQTQFIEDKYTDDFIDEFLLVHIFRVNKLIIDAGDFATFRNEIDYITNSIIGDPSNLANSIEAKLNFEDIINNKEINERGQRLRFMIKYECVKQFSLFDEFLTELNKYEQLTLNYAENENLKRSIKTVLHEINKMSRELRILTLFHFAFFQIGVYLVSKGSQFDRFIKELWYHATPTDERTTLVNTTPVTQDPMWVALYTFYGGTGSSQWSEFFEFDGFQSARSYMLQYYVLLLLKLGKNPCLPSNYELIEMKDRNEQYKINFWLDFVRQGIMEEVLKTFDSLSKEGKFQIVRGTLSEDQATRIRSEIEQFLKRSKALEKELNRQSELVRSKPVANDKLEESKKNIKAGYAKRSNANQIAHVQFSSEAEKDDYKEIMVDIPTPRDDLVADSYVYTDFLWSRIGASIADEETKYVLSYLQRNIPLQFQEGLDLLAKTEKTIRILKERGHHPDTMFISLDGKSELREKADNLFPNDPHIMRIDGQEIHVILSPKEFAMNEVLIYSSKSLEITYPGDETSDPLSITFKNTEIGHDEVIIDCRIRMKVAIRDPSAFTRFR